MSGRRVLVSEMVVFREADVRGTYVLRSERYGAAAYRFHVQLRSVRLPVAFHTPTPRRRLAFSLRPTPRVRQFALCPAIND